MSIESWKAEFYPVPADEVSAADALDHSIRKWEGLTRKNMKRHHLGMVDTFWTTELAEEGVPGTFPIDAGTCALCARYYSDESECSLCPLAKAREGVACTGAVGREVQGPYGRFVNGGDPLPMLNLLKRVKAKQEAKGKP